MIKGDRDQLEVAPTMSLVKALRYQMQLTQSAYYKTEESMKAALAAFVLWFVGRHKVFPFLRKLLRG